MSAPDAGLRTVEDIFANLQIDEQWSTLEGRGFTWWAHRHAQRVWAEEPVEDEGVTLSVVHVETEALRGLSALSPTDARATKAVLGDSPPAELAGREGIASRTGRNNPRENENDGPNGTAQTHLRVRAYAREANWPLRRRWDPRIAEETRGPSESGPRRLERRTCRCRPPYQRRRCVGGGQSAAPARPGLLLQPRRCPAAAARYDEFRAWTHDYGLSWDAVALDLEPSAEEMRRLFTPGQRLGLLRTVVPRALGRERLRRGTEAYSGLIARMHADGFRVESYQFPFLIEDRMARSSILHRLLSVPDVRTDRDTWMIYTSFQKRFGPALLASYGPDAEAIAVGSTGGAAEDLEGVVTPTLDWDGLARDLRLAQRFTDEISIHSLEGCISQGMQGRLEAFEWGVEERVPRLQVRMVDSVRRLLRWILWAAAHPYASAAMLTVGVALITKRRRGGD
jgi:hypothetical protein